MALNSDISVDLINETITIICSLGSTPVETITYDNSLKTVTLAKREPCTISINEFLSMVDQINIFQTSILFNFQPSPLQAILPFSQMIVNELHDLVPKTWSLVVSAHTNPNVCDYLADLITTDIDFADRNTEKTIEFSEWVIFLFALSHYRLSLKNYLNV